MSINDSKKNDRRSWKLWVDSGAVFVKSLLNKGAINAQRYMRLCCAARNGTIHPWGIVELSNGLPLWSQRLLHYGRPEYDAEVVENAICVFRKYELVETIPASRIFVPDVRENYVHENGYLQPLVCYDPNWRTLASLDQAEAGEKPKHIDNSGYIRVSKELAGQELMSLLFMDNNEEVQTVLVFKKNGVLVPSKFGYPLSFARWEPNSFYAQYSRRTRSYNDDLVL